MGKKGGGVRSPWDAVLLSEYGMSVGERVHTEKTRLLTVKRMMKAMRKSRADSNLEGNALSGGEEVHRELEGSAECEMDHEALQGLVDEEAWMDVHLEDDTYQYCEEVDRLLAEDDEEDPVSEQENEDFMRELDDDGADDGALPLGEIREYEAVIAELDGRALPLGEILQPPCAGLEQQPPSIGFATV